MMTSVLKEYKRLKKEHPDSIILIRVGDFYEIYGNDAEVASMALGLTLTLRATEDGLMSIVGFPHHALDTYLPQIVRSGHRVAIYEHFQDHKKQ